MTTICEHCGTVQIEGAHQKKCTVCGRELQTPESKIKVETPKPIHVVDQETFSFIITPQRKALERIFTAMTRHYLTLYCPQCSAEINYRDTSNAVQDRLEELLCPHCGSQVLIRKDVITIGKLQEKLI